MNESKIFDSNKLLSDIATVWGHAGAHYEVCKMLIENNANWIQVTPETLPQYYKHVLCFGSVPSYSSKSMNICWRSNNGENDIYTISGTDFIMEEITHWMPLPTPPNDKNQ